MTHCTEVWNDHHFCSQGTELCCPEPGVAAAAFHSNSMGKFSRRNNCICLLALWQQRGTQTAGRGSPQDSGSWASTGERSPDLPATDCILLVKILVLSIPRCHHHLWNGTNTQHGFSACHEPSFTWRAFHTFRQRWSLFHRYEKQVPERYCFEALTNLTHVACLKQPELATSCVLSMITHGEGWDAMCIAHQGLGHRIRSGALSHTWDLKQAGVNFCNPGAHLFASSAPWLQVCLFTCYMFSLLLFLAEMFFAS